VHLSTLQWDRPPATYTLIPDIDPLTMSSMLPIAVYGLKVPAGDVMIPATADFPATVSTTATYIVVRCAGVIS